MLLGVEKKRTRKKTGSINQERSHEVNNIQGMNRKKSDPTNKEKVRENQKIQSVTKKKETENSLNPPIHTKMDAATKKNQLIPTKEKAGRTKIDHSIGMAPRNGLWRSPRIK